ncbi:MAG: phage baseplate protein [Coriobacteriia bacterium]|nr:phage baseplate protein [Coriobacteriia bacterium]
MIRRFTLRNALRDELNLLDKETFGYDPSGLGVSIDNSYIGAGGDMIPTSSSLTMHAFTIDIIFGYESGRSYEKYKEVAQFLSHGPFTMVYETNAGRYEREYQLGELSKTEIGNKSALDETLTLEPLTPWYRMVSLEERTVAASFDTGAYGKTYAVDATSKPPAPELLADPMLTSMDALSIESTFVSLCSLSDAGAPFDGFNVLTFNGLRAPMIDGCIEFVQDTGTLPVTGILSFWFKQDTADHDRGSIAVPSSVIPLAAFIGGVRVNVLNRRGLSIIETDNLTFGWHKIDILLEISWPELATTIHPVNRRGTTYFTRPSFTEAVLDDAPGGRYCYAPEEGKFVYGLSHGLMLRQHGVFDIVNRATNTLTSGSPAIVRLHNSASNPFWEVVQGGRVVQSDGYFVDVYTGQTLEVSSFPQDNIARLVEDDGSSSNLYQKQDLTRTNFITIPAGSSTLSFDGVTGEVEVLYREEHLVV